MFVCINRDCLSHLLIHKKIRIVCELNEKKILKKVPYITLKIPMNFYKE